MGHGEVHMAPVGDGVGGDNGPYTARKGWLIPSGAFVLGGRPARERDPMAPIGPGGVPMTPIGPGGHPYGSYRAGGGVPMAPIGPGGVPMALIGSEVHPYSSYRVRGASL